MKKSAFNERIKQAREHAGLTQTELGSRVGISQSAVHKLECGPSTSSRKTVDIALACHVDPIWLATGEGTLEVLGKPNRMAVTRGEGDARPVKECKTAQAGREAAGDDPPSSRSHAEMLQEESSRLRRKLWHLEKYVDQAMVRMKALEQPGRRRRRGGGAEEG